MKVTKEHQRSARQDIEQTTVYVFDVWPELHENYAIKAKGLWHKRYHETDDISVSSRRVEDLHAAIADHLDHDIRCEQTRKSAVIRLRFQHYSSGRDLQRTCSTFDPH